MSRYTGGPLSHSAAAASIREVALWRGHKSHVTSLDWVDPAAGAGIGGGRLIGRLFLASSSADCTITLWSEGGVRVGTFGQNTWSLTDPGSWAAREVDELDVSACRWGGVVERAGQGAWGVGMWGRW